MINNFEYKNLIVKLIRIRFINISSKLIINIYYFRYNS